MIYMPLIYGVSISDTDAPPIVMINLQQRNDTDVPHIDLPFISGM